MGQGGGKGGNGMVCSRGGFLMPAKQRNINKIKISSQKERKTYPLDHTCWQWYILGLERRDEGLVMLNDSQFSGIAFLVKNPRAESQNLPSAASKLPRHVIHAIIPPPCF